MKKALEIPFFIAAWLCTAMLAYLIADIPRQERKLEQQKLENEISLLRAKRDLIRLRELEKEAYQKRKNLLKMDSIIKNTK